MSIRKRRTSTGSKDYAVTGSERLHFLWHTAKGQTLQVSLSVGNAGDKREYLSIDVMHDPAADVEFDRDPQTTTLIFRLPKEATPMGITSSAADWIVGNTEIKGIPPAGKIDLK